MAEDYSQNIIKDYKYWTVYAHTNQGYLGRCVVWCEREDATDLAEATPEEQEELFSVLHALRAAVTTVFAPTWFNYAFLGNEDRHLHCHFVPRYEKPSTFMGMTFEDKLYGHHYKTDRDFITSKELLMGVRDAIREVL